MRPRVTEDLLGACDVEVLELPSIPPVAVSLGDLQRPLVDDAAELLKSRYLCRGGGLLLVGPTGVGKSSLSMQAMLLWSLGRPAFGIEPPRPLKSLLIQAENDNGDLFEMRDGVVRGLELQAVEATDAYTRIMVSREDVRTGSEFFRNTVRPLLAMHRPDLLWIDPVLAYLGGEVNSQEVVSAFLRNQLNPLLREFDCGAVVVHHTNKPPKKSDATAGAASDLAYLGAGSAEWANWSRAVLALRSTPTQGIFELCAGKRGARLKWRTPDGSRVFSQYIAHSRGEGEIYWRPATEAEIESSQSGGKKIGTSEAGKILLTIPPTGSMEKSALLEACKTRDIGRDKATKLINQLIAEGKIHQVQVPRPGTRPEVHLAHGPGPEEPTPEQASPDCQPTPPSKKPPGPPPCPIVLESGGLGNRDSTAVPTGLEQPVATPVATHQ